MKKSIFLFMLAVCTLSLNSYAQTINYTYDNLGRLTKVLYPDSSAITYAYDNGGNNISAIVHDPCSSKPRPAITASGPLNFYSGDSVMLSINSGGQNYKWSTGDSTHLSIKVTSTGKYAVWRLDTFHIGGDTLQCNLVSDSIQVNVYPSATAFITGSSSCTSGLLTANCSAAIEKVVWKLNGSPVDSVFATTIVAGGHGSGSDSNQLNTPYGIFVDSIGNVYVADLLNHRVQKWALGANTGITVAGVTGNDQIDAAHLRYPHAVCVDRNGNIYVSNVDADSWVSKWAPGATSGTIITYGQGPNGSPINGLCLDDSDNLYASDEGYSNVLKFAPGSSNGVIVAGGYGTPGSAANQFNFPWGIHVDASGNLYVADYLNNRIQKWAPGTTSGTTVAGGHGQGSAANQLYAPSDVYVDVDGSIYVLDQANGRIQKWLQGATAGNTVLTPSSSVGIGFYVDHNGSIYYSNASNTIYKYNPNPNLTHSAISPGTYTATITTLGGQTLTTPSYTVGQTRTWYQDNDGDGWGNLNDSIITCTPLTGYVLNNLDPSDNCENGVKSAYIGNNGFSNAYTQDNSIAVDTKDAPYMVFSDGSNGEKATVMKYNGSAWVTLGGQGFSDTAAYYTSIALDKNDTPYVIYAKHYGPYPNRRICLSKFYGSSWVQLDTSGQIPITASYPSFAIDGNSKPCLVFRDEGWNYRVSVMRYDGYSWEYIGIPGFSAGGALYPHIAFDASGTPYVGYCDSANGQKASVLKYNGTNWVYVGSAGFSAGVTAYNSIAIDNNGIPYVIYIDQANSSKATVMKYNGNNWVTVGNPGFSINSVAFTSIAIDNSGTPFVTFRDGDKARIMKFNGSGWVTVGDTSTAIASYTSITLDQYGIPYIGFSEDLNNSKASVMKIAPQITYPTTPSISASITAICSGVSTTLSIVSGSLNDASTWNWYANTCGGVPVGSGTSISVSPSVNTTYYVRGEGACIDTPGNCGNVAVGVNALPIILSHPKDTLILPGANASFSVNASGAGLTYQWQTDTGIGFANISNGSVYTGTTNSILNIAGATTSMAGYKYQCLITTACSVSAVSNSATLGVLYISANTLCPGSVLTLNSGLSPSQIIWKRNDAVVQTMNAAWNGVTVAGGNGAGTAANQLNAPYDVFVDNNNDVYIADYSVGRIQKWAAGASSGTTVAGGNGNGPAANQLNGPSDIFVDDSGNIYVADYNHYRIQKWAPGATSGITVAGGNGAGSAANQISGVNGGSNGIFVDASGNIYIADYTNNRIQKWATGASSGITVVGGNGAGSAANQLNGPNGVFVDGNNNIYIADEYNYRIQKWAPGATSGITVAGGNGPGSAANQINNLGRLFVDGYNNIYIADRFNNRIQRWAPGDTNGTTVVVTNGSGSANQFLFPNDVFLDANGNIYVADDGNNRIQKYVYNVSTIDTAYLPGTYTATINTFGGSSITTNGFVINPIPNMIPPSNQTICNGASTPILTFSSNVPGTTYSWVNNNTSIGLAASGSGNIPAFTSVNTTNAPLTDTITVTPTFNGCIGSPQIFTITVNPTPTVNSIASQTLCNGNPSSLVNFSGLIGSSVYNWANNNSSIGLVASGTGNITSFTATNIGNAAISSTITVTPAYTNNNVTCTGVAKTFSYVVNPTPNVNTIFNQTLCNGIATAPVTFNGNVAGTTYSWSNNITSIGLGASGAGNIASFSVMNITTSPVTATITVTPLANSCTGNIQSFNFVVNPTPGVTLPSNQVVCNGATTNSLSFSGGVTGTTFSWTNNTSSIGLATSGTGSILPFTANNSTASPVVATIAVIPSANSCNSSPQNFTITVNPTPTVSAVSNQTLCNGIATNPVAFSGTVTGTAYSWSNSNSSIGLSPSGNGSIASFTATNIGSSPATGIISVTPSANGCTGVSQAFNIIVNPTPGISNINNQTICNNAATTTVALSGSSVSGTLYNWTNSNTAIGLGLSGTGNIASFIALNSGSSPINVTITVTPISNNCSGTQQTFVYTVNPTPSVLLPSSQIICAGANTSAIAFSGSSVSGTSYNWTNTNSSIGIGISGTGNISSFTTINSTSVPVISTLSITPVANACSGTSQTFTVTVNPTPTINSVTNQTLCNGVNTSPITFSGSVSGTTYNWTNSATSIGLATTGTGAISSFIATNNTSSPVTSTLAVTPLANNCSGTPQNFTITVNPTPDVIVPDNQVACNNNNVSSLTFNGNVNGTSYGWSNNTTSIGLGSTGTGNISSFVASNVTNVSVTATITVTPTASSCVGTAQDFSITVNPTPGVTLPSSQVVCNQGSVSSMAFSSSVSGTTFAWNNNTISIGLSASGFGTISSFTASNTTNVPVVATISVTPTANSCSGISQSLTITVNPAPSVTNPGNQTVCNGSNSSVISIGGSLVSGTIYNWVNNTTSIGLAGSGSGNISSFSATNSSTATVTAAISVTPTANSCPGSTQNFTISVFPTPILSSNTSPSATCNNTSFTYSPSTLTSGTSYSWGRSAITNISPSTGSGTGDINEILINSTPYPILTTYVYTLTANGCNNSQNIADTVKPTPVLSSSLIPSKNCNSTGFTYAPSSFTNGTSYTWSRTTIANIVPMSSSGTGIIYDSLTNSTTYPIVVSYTYLLASYGCTNTQLVTDTIEPTAILSSSFNPPSVCDNANLFYHATTAIPDASFTWLRDSVQGITPAYGSGLQDINETLHNVTPNAIRVTYQYSLTVDGCLNTQSVFDTIKPTPTLSSSLFDTICNNSSFVYIPASTTGGTQFTWSRGAVSGLNNIPGNGNGNINETLNDTTSSAVNTVYVYTLSANGCNNPNAYNINVTVDKNPTIAIQPSPSIICPGSNTSFTVVSSGTNLGFQWQVDTGTGFNGITNSGVYTGSSTDSLKITNAPFAMNGYHYQCVISGICGPIVTSTIILLTVDTIPGITNQPVNTSICEGENTTFNIAAYGTNINFQWQADTGTGFYSLINSSTCSGATTPALALGNGSLPMSGYRYRCVVSGTCLPPTISIIDTLVVHPRPQPIINNNSPTQFCAGDSVRLSVNGGMNYSYQWQLNGGNINNAADSFFEAHQTGSYTVSVINNFGCSTLSTSQNVSVYSFPVAPITISSGNLTFCPGDSVSFTTNLNNGLIYQWRINGQSISGANASMITIGISGDFDVIVSNHGCPDTSAIQTVLVKPVPSDSLFAGPRVICSGSLGCLLFADSTDVQNYTWYLNGIVILGTDHPTFLANTPGTYSVNIIDSDNCSLFTQSVNITASPSPTPIINLNGLVLSTEAYASYQWYLDSNAIPGATNSTDSVAQNGNYTVTVIDSNGCSGTSPAYNISNLGIVKIPTLPIEVKIYPNPTTNIIYIEATAKVNVSVSTLLGQVLIRKGDARIIDLREFANGIYIIRVFDENNTPLKIDRIVKNSW